MTVQAQARAARRPAVAGSALAPALAGLAFLVARPGLEALPAGARTGVLAAGAATPAGRPAAAATLAPRGRAGAARRPGAAPGARGRAGAVLVVGVAAVVAAALLAGAVPPLPAGVVVLALSLLPAVAEEALFRGALYGLLERWGAVVAVGTSALLFALVHVPSYGLAAMPVDLSAGLLFGWQRWASGRWTVPAATHAAANLLAVILR